MCPAATTEVAATVPSGTPHSDGTPHLPQRRPPEGAPSGYRLAPARRGRAPARSARGAGQDDPHPPRGEGEQHARPGGQHPELRQDVGDPAVVPDELPEPL